MSHRSTRPAPSARAVPASRAGLLTLVLAAVLAGVLPMLTAPARADPVGYLPPVDGPVVDPFRPPAVPWGPGNRGIDYATVPLAPVRAAADGEVVFAGRVGGTLHVTVRHADGLRTSYSFLAAVDVVVGQRVRQGETVGRSGDVVHVGARRPDGSYLDPSLLFAGRVVVHLVPGGDDGGRPAAGVAEPAALGATVSERWGPLGQLLGLVPGGPALADAAGVLVDPLARRLRTWEHYAVELAPATHLGRWGRGLIAIVTDPAPCTPPDETPPAPAGRRIVVLVGGFGSSSDGASVEDVDVDRLGYDRADVVRFSYAGGQTAREGQRPSLGRVAASGYHAVDTQQDLTVSGDRLAALLTEVAAAEPGVPIDIVGHSQGGVVARLALQRAEGEGALPPEVQNLVTLGAPHQGADLATALEAVGEDPAGAALLEATRRGLHLEVDAASPAAHQLAEVSPLVEALRHRPVPEGVRFTSIGARGDLIVPAGRTVPPPGPATASSVVDLAGVDAHDRLPADPATTREIALAVAGRPPTCRSTGARFADLVVSDAIGGAEDLLGAGAAALTGVVPP